MKRTSGSVDMSIAITECNWGTEAPDKVHQRPLHSVKCMAWVAIMKNGIIGLFWFGNADEEAVIVTKVCYICDGKLTKIPKRDFIFARVKTGQVGT